MVEILLFLLFVLTCLYLPGRALLAKFNDKLTSPEKLFLSFSFGIIFFTFISYVFSWLHFEFLMLPLFLGLSAGALWKRDWKIQIEQKHRRPLLIVLFLAILFSGSMLFTGQYGDQMITRKDDLWHLALINELKVNFPPDNPSVAGIPLKGYHFFYNLILAKVSNVFHISPLALYFHFFPLFMGLLWGIGVYAFMFRWSKKISVALWSVLLTMFGGSFAYLFLVKGFIMLNNGLGISQPAVSLVNPPFTLSIIFLLTALLAMHHYLVEKQNKWLIPLTFAIGLVTMVKVYAGIILVAGFLVLTCFELLKRRWIILSALGGIGFLFGTTYLLFSGNAGYLIFFPLWAPHGLLQTFDWYDYDEKMQTYVQQGALKGIVKTEIVGLSIFVLGNLGTRLIGLVALAWFAFTKRKKPSLFAWILGMMASVALLLPLFFIQSGKVFEIIQMSWYFLFFCALFASFGFAGLFALKLAKPIKIVLVLIVLALTLPSAVFDYMSYGQLKKEIVQSASSPYFQTMAVLAKQDVYNSTVLEMPPEDQNDPTEASILGWYKFSTPGVVAFANKRSFLNYEYIDFPGVDPKPRAAFLQQLITFSKTAPTDEGYKKLQEEVINGLHKNNIHYIYSSYEIKTWNNNQFIKKIYQNASHTLYKVDKN